MKKTRYTMRVIRSLKQIMEWRGKPKAIRVDNGPEYISQTLCSWTSAQGISRTPTSSAIIVPSATNGWIYPSSTQSRRHKKQQPNSYGLLQQR